MAAPPQPRELDLDLLAPIPRDPASATARELSPGLWCLRVPLPYERVDSVNCYLLARESGWLLVDCGTEREALARALGLVGVEVAEIAALLLTHGHCDHSELAAGLVAESGCELLMGAGAAVISDALRDPIVPLAERRRRAARDGVPARELDAIVDARVGWHGLNRPPRPDRLLRPGELVETSAASWRVVPAPGHSANQVLLHDRAGGRLISADLAYPATPFLEWGYDSDPVAEFRAGLDAAAALEVELMLPGHGRPTSRPRERIAAAHAALDRIADAVRSALGSAPLSAYGVTCALVGDDPDPDTRQATLATVIALLEHLVANGEVGEIETGSKRRFRRA